MDGGTAILRARVLHSGPTYTLGEVVIEDALGLTVAHATGSVVVRPMDPPPPSRPFAFQPPDDRAYASPDPHERPPPPGAAPSPFLATFDSPARAVECARAIRDGVSRLGVDTRAGLHTGECDVLGADVAGIAVHMASRVVSAAGAGEILVSSTVRDLVAGSGLRFADHGRHHLKGIEGEWQLLSVEE